MAFYAKINKYAIFVLNVFYSKTYRVLTKAKI